jgi:DNA-binding NarL/FixJ family response regulator
VAVIFVTTSGVAMANLEVMPAHLRLATAPTGTDCSTQPESPIRIVLADGHTVVRRSLRRLLDGEENVEVVAEASDLPTAVRHLHGLRPHVLAIDLRPPNGSSIETIRRVREEVPGTEIVVLTMEESPAFAQQALDAGAVGFVLKDGADSELLMAIRNAARGEEYVSRVLPLGSRRCTQRLAAAGSARARSTCCA